MVRQPDNSQILTSFREVMDREQAIAAATLDDLKQMLDPNSRWAFYVFFANLNNYPVIIQNKCNLSVSDPAVNMDYSGSDYDCYIVLYGTDKDGQNILKDTNNPLVVEGGSSKEFVLVTENTQNNMGNGAHLRQSYDNKKSKCQVTLVIQKVGLIKHQRIKSIEANFVGNE